MYPDLFAKYSDHHLPMDLDWSMDLERSMDPSLRIFQVLVHSMDLRSHPMDHQRLHTKMNVTHDSWGFHRYHGNHGIQTCNQRWKLKTRSPKFRNQDLNQSNLTPKDQRRDQLRSNSGRPPDKSIHFETIENGKVHSCKGNEGWCLRIRSYLKQDTFWAERLVQMISSDVVRRLFVFFCVKKVWRTCRNDSYIICTYNVYSQDMYYILYTNIWYHLNFVVFKTNMNLHFWP